MISKINFYFQKMT